MSTPTTSRPFSAYFLEYDQWPEAEKEAIGYARGRVLDIGCGAGRHALHLHVFRPLRENPERFQGFLAQLVETIRENFSGKVTFLTVEDLNEAVVSLDNLESAFSLQVVKHFMTKCILVVFEHDSSPGRLMAV